MTKYGSEGSPGTTFKGERSFLQGPYHFCARCGSRVHIAEMQWQRGLLICSKYDCIDYGTAQNPYPLMGQREAAISQVFEVPTEELMPDPKLRDPDVQGNNLEDAIIY